jgi:protein AbiQ
MADLKFYEVDASYIDYLLEIDSKVPRVDYSALSPHDKFLCGIVLTINDHDYFAPISSFKKQQRTNVLIRNAQGRVLSSIRLSFMIPIPPGAASLKDIAAEPSQNYKFLLYNELRFCNKNADYIRSRAKFIYDAVAIKKIPFMIKNCCDFLKLEAACADYSLYLNGK